MSKRDLKKYLKELTKPQLEEQIIDLYARFSQVKGFYDFAFNPDEKKLMEECKFKIGKEYFPPNGRKPKKRRSVAQKYIKHFKQLGVDAPLIADVMLYNIEIAQAFCHDYPVKQDAFYTSLLKSFNEALQFVNDNGLAKQFYPRLEKIARQATDQRWFNRKGFDMAMDGLLV